MSLPVPQVSGWRADEFSDLMAVLEFAQSIFTTARASPKSDSAMASTTRVFPEPVGPRNKKFPTGRLGAFKPARNI